MNNIEIFKDIPGYEGLYQVSDLGNVKSLSREVLNRGEFPAIVKEKILKINIVKSGYYLVGLCKEGKVKTMSVHVLVAMAFLGHIPDGNKIEVDHKNEIKTDNRVENLQLLSGVEHRRKPKKSRNTSSKYTGVNWHKTSSKWRAEIRINGKPKNLGYYTTEYQAHYAYQSVLLTLKNN
jgi:hypothetical protein